MADIKKIKHRKNNKPWQKDGVKPPAANRKEADNRPRSQSPRAAAGGPNKTGDTFRRPEAPSGVKKSSGRPPRYEADNRPRSGSAPSASRYETDSRTRQSLPAKPTEVKPAVMGYAEYVGEVCREFPNKVLFDIYAADPLAGFTYQDECLIKQKALELFWRKNDIPGTPEKIIPSPLSRGYRTNSKRRVLFYKGKASLVLEQSRCEPGTLQQSSLEPALHLSIYQFLLDLLSNVNYQMLARSLNFCIIRGSYTSCSVILNVHTVDNIVVRKIKQFAAALKNNDPRIISCFMYVDPTKSDYYLESRRPEKGVALKKLFGPENIDITVDGIRLLYPPTIFSQVNESMLPHFTGAIRELLKLTPDTRMLDLYCGYGLIGLTSAPYVGSVVGMDIEGPAIHAAIENAKYHFSGKSLKFIASPVTADSLSDKLPPPNSKEVVLLDPPRSGTARGVIATIAERQPLRVLHIFCGTDEIPRELQEWNKNGYIPGRILPLDMFPGSPNLETMILLEPGQGH
jgi:tRNA/tmRNA/rRNA uracil-C5-methylase (TrmA/RlmC/RlmD family)